MEKASEEEEAGCYQWPPLDVMEENNRVHRKAAQVLVRETSPFQLSRYQSCENASVRPGGVFLCACVTFQHPHCTVGSSRALA